MTEVFRVSRGDTQPIFEVALTHQGVPYDATGATAAWLRIALENGTFAKRALTGTTISSGVYQYTFLNTDWDEGSVGAGTEDDPFTVGGLYVSPFEPDEIGDAKHFMKYEVVGPLARRITFPDSEDGPDILHIESDYGDD